MYFERILSERNIPALWDEKLMDIESARKKREEYLEILQREIYGKMPPKPDYVKGVVVEKPKERDFAGKGIKKKVEITFSVLGQEFTFPAVIMSPKAVENPAWVMHINFRDNVPDEYLPAEEIIDRGIAVAMVCYKDITSDDGDFTNGFAGVLSKCGYTDTGKIAMWAYCASRMLDYVLAAEKADMTHIAVAGHSRLGKTALVAGAFDERFTHAYSNNSGCSGAAITRGKVGEQIEFITKTFPFWFCDAYKKYANNHDKLPFDQHYLIAAIAPRCVYVASAALDTWADPESEYLACRAASPMWEIYGKTGFTAPDRAPIIGDVFQEGTIGYHLRDGVHYMSREDWNKFLDFFRR